MKENYIKPDFQILAFALNEAIASCAEKVHDNHEHEACMETPLGLSLEGMGVTFTTDLDSCASGTQFEEYCYFTSENASGITLFNS